ncbi:hypothetical protein HGRIS_013607 [Hohenbuehelia grisea]|uniref:DUF7330 domain-containing protein n=1 Tax=Hohenbuehelia grisea TaxID=104357 RepID=A0ABR3IW75_9AGAR
MIVARNGNKGSGPKRPLKVDVSKLDRCARMTTEQLLPSPDGSRYQFSSTLRKDHDSDINIRVLLLAPWPEDTGPFAKSLICFCSQSGSVRTEVNRLPGVSDHFFRLYVTSRESDVSVVLPADFHGSVNIEQRAGRRAGSANSSSADQNCYVRYSKSLRARIQAGAIRLNPSETYEDEDEVYIWAPGCINLRLMDESPESPRPVWRVADGRRGIGSLKRIFRLTP